MAASPPRGDGWTRAWRPWLRGKQGPAAAVSPTNVDGVWRAHAPGGHAAREFVLPGEVDDEYISKPEAGEAGAAADRECASTAETGALGAEGDRAGVAGPGPCARATSGEAESDGDEDARYACARMAYALSESSMDLALSSRFVQRVAQLAWQHGPVMEGHSAATNLGETEWPVHTEWSGGALVADAAPTTTEYSEAVRSPEHRQMQHARQALLRLQTSAGNIDNLLASPLHCEFVAHPLRSRGSSRANPVARMSCIL